MGKGFYPSPIHAHSSSLERDDTSLAPANGNGIYIPHFLYAYPNAVYIISVTCKGEIRHQQVVSEGERNPKKVGPCIDRERCIEKTKFSGI